MKRVNYSKKHRQALTLFVIIFVFLNFLVSTFISMVGVRFFLNRGLIPTTAAGHPSPHHALTFMFVVGLAVCFVVVSISCHFTLKYVNMFIEQMNRLSNGDFKARLKEDTFAAKHPAIADIIHSFNRLAQELDNTNMLRSDFINNFSHEFKTPIVSIAGFAKLLQRGNLNEQQKAEYLHIIEEESLRLSAMATNVLNMTKVENQSILSDVTAFNLSEQIRNSVLLLENGWTKKKLELSLEFDEYEISADEELLKQVWINLIDNAIKFSPEYGMLAVRISKKNNFITVNISNHGEEIPQEMRERIFDKFYQADRSHSTAGNGIGLAIVKKVVELHSGSVAVSCGNGITTFTVSLPEKQ